ncbi:hypothetical protein L1987_24383 [Smallanthus sonchifolius]|uniref:Uncharacterized protein n=1 Tax=Smallanthus sonchifolius TaxID=185202 RepID=A0ACB9IK21_9ASTR|nr:hypothetical protein L1987_24383 [Smallanthus sonchifolius]
MDLLFAKKHNICAYLNATDPKNAEFTPVLNFLANSNISFAINNNLPVFETTIRQFWATATSVSVNNTRHIRATVHNQEVLFSEATIREVLQFNDNPEAPIEFPSFYIRECFRRMGHPNKFIGGQVIKNALPPLWRYIVHIFIHCISIRKGGFDSANALIASAILGLVKGREYNFSGLVFGQLIENLTGRVKDKFLAYPRFLQMVINHLHPDLQQDGPLLILDHMNAKTLSYMKSSSSRTNRVIANVPLFGHILGEEEEAIPDVDPELPVESSSSSAEEEEPHNEQEIQEAENQNVEVEIQENVQQEMGLNEEDLIFEAPMIDQVLENSEPIIQEEHVEAEADSEDTLDEGIYGTKYDVSDYETETEDHTEPPASSSKRQAESESDYELEEPLAKKIKTGLEPLSTSSESLDDIPENLTPIHSPIHAATTPQPTPQPSPQQSPIHTSPTSPSHNSTSPVPRVKTLSLELKRMQDQLQKKDEEIEGLKSNLHDVQEEVKDLKLEVGGLHTQIDIQQTQLEEQQNFISKQNEDFKVLAEAVKQLKASIDKPVQQQATTSMALGEITSVVEPLSPAIITDPESTMTIFTGHAEKTKEAVEVKVEGPELDLPSASERRDARKKGKGTSTEIETVILDEEDIPSDDELNALLNEIEIFGYNDLYPEILTTEEKETERTRYFTEEGEEIQTLSDEEKDEEEVLVNLIKKVTPEPTTTASESIPAQDPPSVAPEPPTSRKSWFRKIIQEESPKTYEWIAEHQELKRPPIGWKYDAERKLFIIRRYRGGVQHFKNMTDFQTLPFYDLRDLAKLPLQNPGKVMMAYDFEKFLHSQVNNDFKGMKPRKTQKKISKTRFHPKTNKPYVFLRYKPAQTHKTITIPKSVPVQLQTFRKWFYNPVIGSAVIECKGKEDIIIFEPMELLKFQPEDLEVLFQNHIQAYSDEDEADAKAYQRVVSLHVKPFIPRTTEGPAA